MNEVVLSHLIDQATSEPPAALALYCEQWYSPYYHLMYLLAKSMSPCIAVELGVHNGRGAFALAMEPRCTVLGVDSHKHHRMDILRETCPNFTFLLQSSLPVADNIPIPISIIHIDTEHTYTQAKNEFTAYEPLLADVAVVLFDDTHAMDDAVLRFVNELPHHKIHCDQLHPGCGYSVVLYRRHG